MRGTAERMKDESLSASAHNNSLSSVETSATTATILSRSWRYRPARQGFYYLLIGVGMFRGFCGACAEAGERGYA